MAKLASKSDHDSAESVTFGWLGFRVAEYDQKTQSKFGEHEYASGNKVVYAC